MSIPIAIPEPTSSDQAYNARALPQYIDALAASGAEAVVVSLQQSQEEVARQLAATRGVLLPGSGFDIDPQIYGEARIPACGQADAGRSAVDELLLQDAFNLRKPILAICYGVQSMNVWRNGPLIQDLAAAGKTQVNHAPGRHINEAHSVEVRRESRIGRLLGGNSSEIQVNSSHHQALRAPGDNLAVVGVSPVDGVIEAVELESAEHFVVGVQWHPERTFGVNALSRALFAAFVREAGMWRPREAREAVRA